MRKRGTYRLIVALLFACVAGGAFAQQIISPVAGTWANRQPLVLDTSDGTEYFYSYSGTDPLTSGFAYDGPVLIDATGDIQVRVLAVKGDRQEELTISYRVAEQTTTDGTARRFVDSVHRNPLILYRYGSAVQIPESLRYALGDDGRSFAAGTTLSLSPANRLSRYLPCTITDGERQWRFVIFVSGGEAGVLAKQNVPFEINGWNEFVWKGERLIYAIDDGLWSADRVPQYLDRSKSHTIRWQSVAYEKGNPVQTFVLPPMPTLDVRANAKDKGPVTFTIRGDTRYRMELVSSGTSGGVADNVGLFTSATFDTFAGDAIDGTALFAVYCDGVYQGNLSADYAIDNKPPAKPEFLASADGLYARTTVDVRIVAEAGSEVFYAVSDPVPVDGLTSGDAAALDAIGVGSYHVYGNMPVQLPSGDERAQFYKVRAYATDRAGNTSEVAEYRVIIDEFNYYLDASASPVGADGSRAHPFTSFAQAAEVINRGRFARFYVSGIVELPATGIEITSNCAFVSLKNARFVLPPAGSIVLRTASLSAQGCVFEKSYDPRALGGNGAFFTLENAAVSFDACEIVGVFGASGTLFNASSSVLDFTDTGLTVQGDMYACGVSSTDSKVTGRSSRFAAVAQTAVNFSVQGGLFELRESECKVVSHLGRIAELTGTNARITDTSYLGEFDNKVSAILPIWQDEKTLMLENRDNTAAGFN
ncbi:MAG: chitobiase/beta-hexosaminidase C-terminal domain-containing protein [Treponema sp.]|nr:chitobiase/beta-hexosaminidase C-terminal domain-containing protein [Treponema sp.]